jgi:Fibronectin type III domain
LKSDDLNLNRRYKPAYYSRAIASHAEEIGCCLISPRYRGTMPKSFTPPAPVTRDILAARRRCLTEALESRMLLTGDSFSWVLDQPATLPVVRGEFDFSDIVSGRASRFRGVNLTGSAATNVFTIWEDVDANGHPLWGASTDLLDGNYEFSMPADAFVNPPAERLVQSDFFLAGDFDRNRVVDFNDLLTVAQNYNSSNTNPTFTYLQGDANFDGLVNFNDQLIIAQKYNAKLAAAPTYAGEVTVSSLGLDYNGNTPLVVSFATIPDVPATATDPLMRITGYNVYRSTNGFNYPSTPVGFVDRGPISVPGHSFIDNTAADGQKYWYRIRPTYEAVNAAGQVIGTGLLPTTNEASRTAVMKPPTDLTVASVNSTSVRLNWTDQSGRETNYFVYRVDRGGGQTLIQTLPANTQTTLITGLVSDEVYTYRVKAANASIDTAFVQITTSPTFGAKASNVSDGIVLAWTPPAAGLTYKIVRTNPSGSESVVGSNLGATADNTSMLDASALQRGQTYSYSLYTFDQATWQNTLVSSTTITYDSRPEINYTSDTITIIWPSDQTPPPTLEITVTAPDGTAVTTTVTYTPPDPVNDDPGGYQITNLTPNTQYTLTWNVPGETPTGPGEPGPSGSDDAVVVATRTPVDLATLYWLNNDGVGWNSPPYPGVRATITPREDNGDAAWPVQAGDTLKFDLSNLPEHDFIGGSARLTMFRIDTDENGTVIPGLLDAEDLDAELTATFGGTMTATNRIDSPTSISFEVGTANDWIEHSGTSATATFQVSAAAGWWLAPTYIWLKAGTPDVDVTLYAPEDVGITDDHFGLELQGSDVSESTSFIFNVVAKDLNAPNVVSRYEVTLIDAGTLDYVADSEGRLWTITGDSATLDIAGGGGSFDVYAHVSTTEGGLIGVELDATLQLESETYSSKNSSGGRAIAPSPVNGPITVTPKRIYFIVDTRAVQSLGHGGALIYRPGGGYTYYSYSMDGRVTRMAYTNLDDALTMVTQAGYNAYIYYDITDAEAAAARVAAMDFDGTPYHVVVHNCYDMVEEAMWAANTPFQGYGSSPNENLNKNRGTADGSGTLP